MYILTGENILPFKRNTVITGTKKTEDFTKLRLSFGILFLNISLIVLMFCIERTLS